MIRLLCLLFALLFGMMTTVGAALIMSAASAATYVPEPTVLYDGVSGRNMTLADPSLHGMTPDGRYVSPLGKGAFPVLAPPIAPPAAPRYTGGGCRDIRALDRYQGRIIGNGKDGRCQSTRPSETLGFHLHEITTIHTRSGSGGGGRKTTTPQPVPLPAAAWLLIAGLGGIGALKLRGRAK